MNLNCRPFPCRSIPGSSCGTVVNCINTQLTRVANDQSTTLVNFCQATSSCINEQLLDYSTSSLNLLTNFSAALDTYLKTLPGYTDTGNIFLAALNDTLEWEEGGSGSGSVTSVALSSITDFAFATGTPITSSGTLGYTLETQDANLVFAGPVSGSSATPTFRALVAGDVPTPTLQQVIDQSGVLTVDNVIETNNNDLLIGNTNIGPFLNFHGGVNTLDVVSSIITIQPTVGVSNGVYISNLQNVTTQDYLIGQYSATGKIGYIIAGSGITISGGQISASGGGSASVSTTFNATTDWGVASGGFYSFAFTHSLASASILVTVWDETSTPVQIFPDVIQRTNNNTLTIKVPDIPDNRFAGRIVVIK